MRVRSRFLRPVLVLVLLFLSSRASAQLPLPPGARNRIAKALEDMEVKPQDPPPAWYDPAAEPLFRFVQMSDFHWFWLLQDSNTKGLLESAIDFVNDRVRPSFVAITGDNAGLEDPAIEKGLKDLLDARLKARWFMIRGDNWPASFPGVFGSTRFAFECGGIRFVFTGLEQDDTTAQGVGRFLPDTWEWMEKELAPEGPLSVVLFLHENVQPPVFLDAPRLDALLEKSPAAAATFTGHLHFDLEFQAARVKHVLCPGFGPGKRHGLKVVEVHEKLLAVRTVEFADGAFRFVPKVQKVDLPHPARKPAAQPLEAFRSLPARATVLDLRLADHSAVLMLQLLAFAKRIGKDKEFARLLRGGKEPEKKGEDEEF
jgi:hypothetical protein